MNVITVCANTGLHLLPPCFSTWFKTTSPNFTGSFNGNSAKATVLGSRLHIRMLAAWEKPPAQPLGGDHIITCNWGISVFKQWRLGVRACNVEWKPCAAWVSDGQSVETCWQLWMALSCTSAQNNSTRLAAPFRFCRKTVFVATVGSKSIACIKLPHNTQSSIAPKWVHMVSRLLGVFLIRLRF